MFCACCIPRKKRKEGTEHKRKSRRARRREKQQSGVVPHHPSGNRAQHESHVHNISAISRTVSGRTFSEGDEVFYDCKDDFSDAGSEVTSAHPLQSPWEDQHDVEPPQICSRSGLRSHLSDDYDDAQSGRFGDGSSSGEDEDEDEDEDDTSAVGLSCLPMLDRVAITGHSKRMDGTRVEVQAERVFPAGTSLQRRDISCDQSSARECWDECEASVFQVRSLDYMRTKVKVSSAKPWYRLVAMDMLSFPTKANHVARLVTLPNITSKHNADSAIPPLLILNLQLPTYQPPFFGTPDGPGHSMIFYFQLRDDFDPSTAENQAALYLFQRFISNGKEADGTFTRDRFKLIPRVANPDEWAQRAPLSSAEHKLLKSYNEKPVLTRPQHLFFNGPGYLEVDLDVHQYAFLARKALVNFLPRIQEAVWDVGFVIQGNAAEELPELVIACGRVFRVDFDKQRPHSSFLAPAVAAAEGAAAEQPTGARRAAGDEAVAATAAAGGAAGGAAGVGVGNTV